MPDIRDASFELADLAIGKGFKLRVFESLGSTNDAAMGLARDGHDRVWVISRSQTGGRGRHGRTWISPRGNLYASLLLVDAMPVQLVPQLGFVAGVAVARTLRNLLAGDERLKLKWPNDILFEGRKLGGILLEATQLKSGAFATIIGIGVNCASYPRDLPFAATALSAIDATLRPPEHVFHHLSAEIAMWLDIFDKGAGFETIRTQWLSLAAGLDEPIDVKTPTFCLAGRFRTIDRDGRLVLENAGGTVAIEAGDVTLAH